MTREVRSGETYFQANHLLAGTKTEALYELLDSLELA